MSLLRIGVIASSGAAGFAPIEATGGTVQDVTIGGVQFRVHQFTTVGTSSFVVQSLGTSDGSVEAFLVGGGGAGNNGGGAGGFTITDTVTAIVGSNTVVVGRGGLRSNFSGSTAESGVPSSVLGITASGGGGAFNANSNAIREGGSGGCGGGASASASGVAGAGGSDGSNGGSGSRGQGGSGQGTTTREFGDANGTLYAGGGGAGIFSGSPNVGGAGGGGDGVTVSIVAGDGVNGLGGGGGGTGGANSGDVAGGNGGSGIVIVRYPLEAT